MTTEKESWGSVTPIKRNKTIDPPPPPPNDSDMEKRLSQLEALVPNLATKADVEKASHDVAKWVVGTMLGGVGMFIVIMTFVLNNAVPKSAPTSPPAPVTIQAPQAAPALPPIIIQMPPQQIQATAPAPPQPAKP